MNKLTDTKDGEIFAHAGGNYYVSNYGRVYNTKSKKVTTRPYGDDKYYRVKINGRKYRIHRLVAKLFVPNPDNKPFVDHIDGDRYNNRADNLEWVTEEENVKRRKQQRDNYMKLTVSDLKKIQNSVKLKCASLEWIVKQYGISMPKAKQIIDMTL